MAAVCLRRAWVPAAVLMLAAMNAAEVAAQTSTRLAVLLAEERRAVTAADLATIRAGVRSADTDTALMAIRALGRLERPALVPDIAAALRFELPELRAEAAHAVATAFGRQDATAAPPQSAALRASVTSALATLETRLNTEAVPDVRAALCESIGRLPYADAGQTGQAERALLEAAGKADTVADRLGVAKGLEAFVRMNAPTHESRHEIVDALRGLFDLPDPLSAGRDARVRRLALEALIILNEVDDTVAERAAGDMDAQVRRLAMSAVSRLDGRFADDTVGRVLRKGLVDAVPMVRLEAVHAESVRDTGSHAACALAVGETADPDVHVVLAAIDALAVCGTSPEAVALLDRETHDLSTVNAPRGWHRTAHALVALAGAAPDHALAMLGQFTASTLPPLRLYAAKAAATLNDRATLEALSKDADREVAEEAGRQFGRLTGEPSAASPPSASARKTPPSAAAPGIPTVLTAADLKRLTSPRARVVVRGVGSFDLALFTAEAPATVLRFARLADAGYYDGLSIERVLPNFVVQTRTSAVAANDAAVFPREEFGPWPHVRGAVALSAEHGDAQIFIDLVDNPRFDHQYTVFAQVLNGLDVVDALLEGDVVDRIEIVPGP